MRFWAGGSLSCYRDFALLFMEATETPTAQQQAGRMKGKYIKLLGSQNCALRLEMGTVKCPSNLHSPFTPTTLRSLILLILLSLSLPAPSKKNTHPPPQKTNKPPSVHIADRLRSIPTPFSLEKWIRKLFCGFKRFQKD